MASSSAGSRQSPATTGLGSRLTRLKEHATMSMYMDTDCGSLCRWVDTRQDPIIRRGSWSPASSRGIPSTILGSLSPCTGWAISVRVSRGLWSVMDGSLVAIAMEPLGSPSACWFFSAWAWALLWLLWLWLQWQCCSAPRSWGTSPRGPTGLDGCVCIHPKGAGAMTSSALGEGVGDVMTCRGSFTLSANPSGCVEGWLVGTVWWGMASPGGVASTVIWVLWLTWEPGCPLPWATEKDPRRWAHQVRLRLCSHGAGSASQEDGASSKTSESENMVNSSMACCSSNMLSAKWQGLPGIGTLGLLHPVLKGSHVCQSLLWL